MADDQGTRTQASDLKASAGMVLAPGVAYLQPEEAVLDALLRGWAIQQTSRLLSPVSIEKRELTENGRKVLLKGSIGVRATA